MYRQTHGQIDSQSHRQRGDDGLFVFIDIYTQIHRHTHMYVYTHVHICMFA